MAMHAKGEESKQSQMTNEAKRRKDLFNILLQQQKQQEFRMASVLFFTLLDAQEVLKVSSNCGLP